MIYDELMQGTPIFKVQEDGTETIEWRPPTSKELRAANAIKATLEQYNGLLRALETTQRQVAELQKAINEAMANIKPVENKTE
jgi:hypothetical protein